MPNRFLDLFPFKRGDYNMGTLDNTFNKVIRFYQSLPDKLINDILSQIQIPNRDIKRKLAKNKTNSDKVQFLFNSPLRKMFCDTAYNVVRDSVPFDLKKTSYEEIISGINDNNKIAYTIFFFRWCYEDDESGSSNDIKYFKIFVNSKLFDKILNGKPLDGFRMDKQENETDENAMEIQSVQVVNVTDNIEKTEIVTSDKKFLNSGEKVHKMKLLGRIERRNTYYNFFPQYELIDDDIIEIPIEELKSNYPANGGINLGTTFSTSESRKFLEEDISTDLDSDKHVKNLFVVELNNEDLEPNANEDYQKKIDLQKIVQNGSEICQTIHLACEFRIYKIVTSEDEEITPKMFIDGSIFLDEKSEKFIVDSEKVLLHYKEKYYGPFTAHFRAIDGKYYLKTDAIENHYIVNYFPNSAIKIIKFEKQSYFEIYTYSSAFAFTTVDLPIPEDIIPDEVLLGKIADNISIKMAGSNPDEFIHQCNNSPFFAKVPKEIIDSRINRLQEIIKSIKGFEEKKREVFETLLEFYRSESSEVLEKIIKESQLYKDLEQENTKARSNAEKSANEILELNKRIEQLQNQIAGFREKSDTKVTTEEIEEKNATIKKLQDKVTEYESHIRLSRSIEELEEKRKKLENNNEYLLGKSKEYERKLESVQENIGKVIKAESEKMATLAFDPYISSKMMSEAASWETQRETDDYQKIVDELSLITPSSLCGEKLIDYVVDYVKARRNYSRNEIVNIYINIAQNFITIFSGKPGTGKTSMCNIISETLGLINYGAKYDRFVSVSVERGWSSKRDFIGYYNPLTRKYDKSNSRIYSALKVLDIEKNESKYPFVIMLDEANLSPIEYYWADFMRLTDRSSKNDAYLNIGTDQEVFVPETLRFIATINTDQTTETLSPRLIDRACIINLPIVDLKTELPPENKQFEIITWKNFVEAFDKQTELNSVTQKAIKDIFKLFNDYGMTVSPRIEKGIKRYVKVAQSIMKDETDVLAREKALDFAVVQKLLPKINGYYSLYKRFFESLRDLCREYNLKMTEKAIAKIVEYQENNMGYCQYLI